MALPDWLFYPLVALLAGLLVLFSLQYWPGNDRVAGPFDGLPGDGVEISGRQLGLMQAGPGLTAQLAEEDGETVLRAAAGQRPDEGVRSAGVFLALPERFGRAYVGKPLVITMMLRAKGAHASPEALLTFYTINGARSASQTCKTGPQWQPCVLHYTPRPPRKKAVIDYIGLWPDPQGLSRSVEVKSITIRLDTASEQAAAPAPRQRQ